MRKALLLIDIQKTFRDSSWGERNNDAAENNASRLLASFREHGDLVIHVQHKSQNPNSRFYVKNEGVGFQDSVLPLDGEQLISKSVNSAFIGTHLQDYLEENGVSTLVIAGLTTPHCVSTTTRMASNLGYKTYLVEDATASFALQNHQGKTFSPQDVQEISLAMLHDEFAVIVSTDDVIKHYHQLN